MEIRKCALDAVKKFILFVLMMFLWDCEAGWVVCLEVCFGIRAYDVKRVES
jgi:hypothetical protein